jgi:FkbM family methyltransferase
VKYFLDFGTHYLEGGRKYSPCESGLLTFEEQLFFGKEPPYDWHVLTFEPSAHAVQANKSVIPSIEKRFLSFQAFHAAIGTEDALVMFKWLPGWSAASTCVMEPLTQIEGQHCEEYHVDSMDVKRVVQEIIDTDHDAAIYIKCDIEGAEFAVLPRLLEIENAGKWVKAIYVEWHDRFWQGKPRHSEILQAKAAIAECCARSQVALYDWV